MDYLTWLNQQGHYRCVLVELDYKDAGVLKTAYFSNAAYVTLPTDVPANTPYDPFIISDLSFERSLNEVFTGLSVSKTSDVDLIDQPSVKQLLTKAVYGFSVRIYLGDKSWPRGDFKQIIAGVCDGLTPEQNKIRLKFRDAADVLESPLLTEQYASGSAIGLLKPLCFGRCYNIRPVLIDEALHKYQFNTGISHAVTAVRFNGAVVPGSSYSVNLTDSTITFSVFPTGDVTMDVDGSKPAGTWLQTATQIITRIAELKGLAVDCAGLPGYQLGLYLTTDTKTSQVLDEICVSVGGYWYFDRLGQFKVRHFDGIAAATLELTKDQNVFGTMKPRRVINPVYSLTLGYKRNWAPLSNIAGSVHETTPAIAAELAKEGKTKTVTQAAILSNYPQAETVTTDSLIVTEANATTEINRRLALSAIPRFIYETEQFAAPFQWDIGSTATIEAVGINGDRGVITKLYENPMKGRCNVEFWQ